jgi:putative MATE family efflux protein
MAKLIVPTVLSQLVTVAYNMADTFFIGQTGDPNQVAATNLCLPLFIFLGAISNIFGIGGSSLIARCLGMGKADKARSTAAFCIWTALLAALGYGLLLHLVRFPLLRLLGADEYTWDHCLRYLFWTVTVGSVPTVTSSLLALLVRSEGLSKQAAFGVALGAILNIVLDPIFIFGVDALGIPAMGAMGAAIATVTGQWAAALLALIFNVKFNRDIHLSVKNIAPRMDIIKPVLTVGVPAIIMNSISSVMNFSMNQILMGFAGVGETATGVFSIYYKLQSFFFMPLFGLNNATISIVAFNFGARKPERITGTLKLAVGSAMCFMVLGMLAFVLLPHVLLSIFALSGSFVDMGIVALRVIGLHFPLAAVGIALGASFQALGNGIYSTIVSLCRQLVVLLPAAYLLSLSGNVNLVWWSFPIAEVMSTAVTLFFFLRIYRKKVKPLYA